MDDKHLLNLAKEISEIINRNRVYNANIITELHANENAHSRILRMFLQYDDGKKKYPILGKFLDIPKVKQVFGNKEFKSPLFTNERERIDVLIEEPRSFAIIIENKINGAPDQDTQLERYIESVNGHDIDISYDNIYAIYLTDNGEKTVGECSLTPNAKNKLGYNDECDMGRFVPMNYRYDILPWLEKEVLPNCIEKEELLISALKQYIDYLKCMFGIIENEEQKILIMEKLKKELGINNKDIADAYICFDTIENLYKLQNKVEEIRADIIKEIGEKYIKKPFENYLNENGFKHKFVDKECFFTVEDFNLRIELSVSNKYYFRVQYLGTSGLYFGLYHMEGPGKWENGSYLSKDLRFPTQSCFWAKVHEGTFVKELQNKFENCVDMLKTK